MDLRKDVMEGERFGIYEWVAIDNIKRECNRLKLMAFTHNLLLDWFGKREL